MYILILILLSIPTVLTAQERSNFYTQQSCGPVLTMLAENVHEFEEKPLFSGSGIVISTDSTPYRGGVMFFVNQTTGTWSLLTLYPDGTACVTAAGSQFEPYSD